MDFQPIQVWCVCLWLSMDERFRPLASYLLPPTSYILPHPDPSALNVDVDVDVDADADADGSWSWAQRKDSAACE